jgi:hypothetical protein
LTASSAAVSNTPIGGASGSATSPLGQEIASLQQASQAAHSFYTTYPTDARAAQAKKIEVLSALQSVQLGGTAYQSAALALASAYGADASNTTHDRFDVALTVQTLSLPAILKGQVLGDNGPVYQKLADTLYAQFGDINDSYYLYLNVMRTTDLSTSVATAQKILGMNAPTWAKAEAQIVLNRYALLGKPLNLTVTTYGGWPLNLRTPRGKPTVIYFWSNKTGTDQLGLLKKFATSIPANAGVVYFCLEADLTKVKAARSAAPLPGIFCFEQSGLNSPEETYLGVLQLPYVYILNSQGVLTGFGRIQDLPALITSAGN